MAILDCFLCAVAVYRPKYRIGSLLFDATFHMAMSNDPSGEVSARPWNRCLSVFSFAEKPQKNENRSHMAARLR